MPPSWPLYYAQLTKKQQEKFVAYKKLYNDAHEHSEIQETEMKVMRKRIRETELGKAADKYYEENVRVMNAPNSTWKLWRQMQNDAEDSVVGYKAQAEMLDNARHKVGMYDRQLQKFRSACYTIIDLPEPTGTPTEDTTKQCDICSNNIKDHALSCGHIYCIVCITKMKSECPMCKKSFVKDKVIKLYY
jgi:hypothetical protein